jgi:hypothetical protein
MPARRFQPPKFPCLRTKRAAPPRSLESSEGLNICAQPTLKPNEERRDSEGQIAVQAAWYETRGVQR